MNKITLLIISIFFLNHISIAQNKDTVVMRTRPFLQTPVNNGMTVSWLTNYPTLSHVEYGTDKNNMEKVVTLQNGQVVANNTIHHIRLKDLKADTKYYYRVVSKIITFYGGYKKEFGKEEKSELYSFVTPPENMKNHDFTAIVLNDLHQRTATAKAMIDALGGMKYDFVIFNGDCIDDPKDEQQAVETISKFNDIVGASEIPVIYLRGNHEIRNAYSIWLYDILQGVDGECSYGSFSWGDTRFVLLDCGEDKPDDHWVYYGMNDFTQFREDQVDFLLKETSKKEFKKASHRVLIHHIPLYGLNPNNNFNPCYDLWANILNESNLDCSINAHTHKTEFYPAGKFDNKYPILIGGGHKLEEACITTIQKQNKQLTIKQLKNKGEVIKTLIL